MSTTGVCAKSILCSTIILYIPLPRSSAIWTHWDGFVLRAYTMSLLSKRSLLCYCHSLIDHIPRAIPGSFVNFRPQYDGLLCIERLPNMLRNCFSKTNVSLFPDDRPSIEIELFSLRSVSPNCGTGAVLNRSWSSNKAHSWPVESNTSRKSSPTACHPYENQHYKHEWQPPYHQHQILLLSRSTPTAPPWTKPPSSGSSSSLSSSSQHSSSYSSYSSAAAADAKVTSKAARMAVDTTRRFSLLTAETSSLPGTTRTHPRRAQPSHWFP